METKYIKLKISPSFKHRIDSGSISRESSGHDLPRYTSLKDIILSTSPQHASSSNNEPGNAFDSSNISIRNELVKHAASAYVQSATIINPAMRDQDLVSGIWEKIKISWQIYVKKPVQAFCTHFVHLCYGIVHTIRNAVRGRVEIT